MNKKEELNTAVVKLISTLKNKLIRVSNLDTVRITNLDTRTVRAAILGAGVQISYQHM
jgi:hypothetical protein